VKSAFTEKPLKPYEGFNILGPVVPQARDVFRFINEEYGYPYPHFSVPFWFAYPFARLMEILDPFFSFDPLVTRSIVHLLENTNTDNEKAQLLLGYEPQVAWQEAVRKQIEEIHAFPEKNTRLHKAISHAS
jgi:nucleoside-diphosphate-sugar epimerase